MRRPVMYLAGLLLASGASLALAGPAQAAPAAPSHRHHCHRFDDSDWFWQRHNCHRYDYDDDSDGFDFRNNQQNNGSTYSGFVLLSGNSGNEGGGGLIGSIPIL